MKLDKTVAESIDTLASLPIKYRLKHNKNCTPKQKRAIRSAFNRIKPEFELEVNKKMSDIFCYSNFKEGENNDSY